MIFVAFEDLPYYLKEFFSSQELISKDFLLSYYAFSIVMAFVLRIFITWFFIYFSICLKPQINHLIDLNSYSK